MKSKKRVLASALAAASLAVSSKAQGVCGSTLLRTVAGMAGASAGIGFMIWFANYLHRLFLGYEAVGKEVGVTVSVEESEKIKKDLVEEAVKKLASSISVERGYFTTGYEEAPEGFLSVMCGGQKWFVAFVKDEDNGGVVALCGKGRASLVNCIKKLKLDIVEKHFNNNNKLATEKEELGRQIGMFTWHIVNSLTPESNESFKNAVWSGLCPFMLERIWNTFSQGQSYFVANSEQASKIVEAVEHNYDNFAMFVD